MVVGSPMSPTNGMDEWYGWVVACACCVLMFGNFGVYRSSGVLYVEVIKVFGSNRADASWPFSLCGAVSSFFGIFGGALTHFLTIRTIVCLGVLIGTISLIICSFAQSLFWVTICFGIFLGSGIALINPVTQVIINQYFKKNLASANGILLAGGSLSFFLLLPFTEWLIDTYGFRGALLLLAGCILQTMVAAVLLKPKDFQETTTISPEIPLGQKTTFEDDRFLQEGSDNQFAYKNFSFKEKLKTMAIQSKDILTDPIFFILTYSNISLIFLLLTVGVVLVDYGQDRGLDRDQAVLLVSVSAIPELAGRLGFGLIADRGCFKMHHLMCVLHILSAASVFTLAAAKSKVLLFASTCIFGLVMGCATVLVNVLFAKYMGSQKLGMALGFRFFLNGFAFLVRPIIIGIFRDQNGSYENLFYLLGGASLLSGLTWMLEPFVIKSVNN